MDTTAFLGMFVGILTIMTVVTFAVVDRYKALRENASTAEIVVLSIIVAFGLPFLLASTDFGKQIPVGDTTLDMLNAASLIFIGLLGAGGASVLNQLIGSGGVSNSIGAIGNIGEIDPKRRPDPQ